MKYIVVITVALWCVVRRAQSDQDSLFFSPQPEDVTALEGNPTSLKCGSSEKANVTIYWTLDGQRVEMDTAAHGRARDFIYIRGAQINILWITDSVSVIAADSSDDLSIGEELVLRCKAEGNPETQITWYRNGVRLFRNEKISLKSNKLHITDLALEDNGIYSCKAVNDVGSVNSSENFALRLSDGESPYISVVPRDVIARENGAAYFECSYENAASTQWFFQSEPLENNSKYTIFPNGSLSISFVETEDAGIYECKGESADSAYPDQVYAVQLKIAYIDNMTSESLEPQPREDQTAVVTVHDPYDVTCLAPDGLPKPKMWWENAKGHVINDSGRVYVEDMRLIFSEVEESDAGEYVCVAENVAEKRKVGFTLVVSVAPVIVKHPVDITVDEGETASFQCNFKNSSSAVVYWLKDDNYLKDLGNHIIFNEQNSSLTVRNVVPSDSGIYQCEINSEGFPPVLSEKAALVVREKLKFMPAPVNRKLELGSNAKIYCKAGGSTPPIVKWSRIDIRSSEWPPHIKDDNGTLHFNRVLSTDTGKYMCVATNTQGIINATIDVDVIVMPKFSVQPSDTVANEGDPVILHCLAEGDPIPIIQWDKNNELNGFNHQRFKVLENGSLYASEINADDEGKYGCTAGNSGGLRRHEVSLIVKAKELNTNRIGRGGFGNEEESTMTKTVTITLGAAGVYIILVVGLMMWCRYRRARRKALMLAQAIADAENSDVHDMELKDRNPQKTYNGTNPGEENAELMKNADFNKLLFPREKLSTVMLLGHGEYGEVFLAKAEGLTGDNSDSVVMVKALENKSDNIIAEFNKELTMYSKMKHENVGTLLGICQDTKPHCLIMDYTDWGDLKQFLLATRPEEVSKAPKQAPLSVPQNLIICQQVAVGMEYLAKQFTHKDLAARNCLISSNMKIKISSPCLSLDTYAQEYFQYQSKVIPLRWAPSEAVMGNNWSAKSDVWSFACLVWEVFNKAELPYLEMSNEDVLQKLQAGKLKLSIPEEAPESLVKLLERCWSQNPSERPSFSEVVAVFVELSVAVQM
ncbi:Inactive tyrosine-protein kinase 7 like protein [Argiope bruennichi]|uniref:Inactive tyrosine-protein kinase 7 like protein n=1 Tax=Argiope bruennichi TaxID=94029 RepID=A0A8T0F5X2_ARGBR|nr:Inactive tyrosine-protein kinase 7 like protein [Argiope bruennichi]